MTEHSYRSFAKINLHLAVVGRRADGYHELRTVFQTIESHDRVRVAVRPGRGVSVVVPGGGAPEGDSNLAYRAAALLLDEHGVEKKIEIEIEKRIPAGGGLGGGSSNAATVLFALDELLDLGTGVERLAALGRQLGADVPYFLFGGAALGTERGDVITPLQEGAPFELFLGLPGVAVPTVDVFRRLRLPPERPDPPELTRWLEGVPPSEPSLPDGWNDLEEPVLAHYEAVAGVYNALRRAGASMVRLSGSGGTVFAVFGPDDETVPPTIERVASQLPGGAQLRRTKTLTREEFERRRRG